MADKGVEQKQTSKRRRRWPWILGSVLLVIVLLAALAPYLLSTGAGTSLVESIASGQIRGRMEMGDLSLRWLGPTRIQGLRIYDLEDRLVVSTDVHAQGGVFWAAGGVMDFKDVQVDNPQIALYFDEQGTTSLERAVESPGPPKVEEKKEVPQPRGTLTIKAGDVKLINADGRQYDISSIDATVKLDTLKAIAGELSLVLPNGGQVKANLDVKDLFTDDGQVEFADAQGSFNLTTPGAIDLAPIADYAGQQGTKGSAQAQVKGTFGQGLVDATIDARVSDLTSPQLAQADGGPIDMRLDGTLKGDRDAMAGRMTLAGQPGRIEAQYDYKRSEPEVKLDGDYIVQAILTGKNVTLPNFTLTANGQMDIARLAQVAPGLLALRKDAQVTAGTLTLRDVSVVGGDSPKLGGVIRLADLAARVDGRAVSFEPVELNAAAALQKGVGLNVERAAITSGFGGLNARGTIEDMNVAFSANLDTLRQRLTSLLAAEIPDMAGAVEGTARVRRASDERINLDSTINARGVRYQLDAQRRIDIATAVIGYQGGIDMKDGKPTRAVADQLSAAIDEALRLQAKGSYGMVDGSMQADVDLQRMDLRWVAQKMGQATASEPAAMSGAMAARAQVARKDKDQPISTSGTGTIEALTVNQRRFAQPVTYEWRQVLYSPSSGSLAAQLVRLVSEVATFSATDIDYNNAQQKRLAGKIDLSADIGPALAMATPAGQDAPQVAGQLKWVGDLGSSGDTLRIDGAGSIDNFRAGQGESVIREERIGLTQKLAIDTAKEVLTLETFKVDSGIVSTSLAGTVSDYSNQRVLDISGSYKAAWDRITTLLHELAPATRETVAFRGETSSDIRLQGPLNRPTVTPPWRGLTGSTALAWDSGQAYGLKLGKARFEPALKDAVVSIPVVAIDANEGKLRLGGTVDMGQAPTYSLAGTQAVMDKVRITPQMARTLLARANPIFANVTEIDGTVSLNTKDIVLPLESVKTGGSGGGRLDLANLKMKPSGILTQLLEFGGVATGDMLLVRTQGTDFEIRQGGIVYQNFSMVFPQDFELVFSGIVRFDDTLDMNVRMPLRPAFLKKVGVPAVGVDVARLVGSVDLKVGGTTANPRITTDLRAMATQILREAATGGLTDLLRGPTTRPAPTTTPGSPTTAPATQDRAGAILEGILENIRDRRENNNK